MSIYYCTNCDVYHDNDYILCNEDATACEESEQDLEPEPNYVTQADLDNYLESLSDDPEVMDVLRRLGRR